VYAKNAKEYYAMSAVVIETRSKLKGLVQRDEILTRSLMLAYERTGQRIGRSGSWVRAFISGDPRYSLNAVIAENVRRLCEHIEAGNEKMRRAENAQAHQGNSGMREVADSTALLPPNEYRE
jgi:hypothetical protein